MDRPVVTRLPFARCLRLTLSPLVADILAAPTPSSSYTLERGMTRFEDTRGRERDLLHDGVVDTLVLGVRSERHFECRSHSHQLGERVDAHLPHNPASVSLHRDLADTKLESDLFVQQAGDD